MLDQPIFTPSTALSLLKANDQTSGAMISFIAPLVSSASIDDAGGWHSATP